MLTHASDMIVFAAIVSNDGISAAARQLKVRKSTVSRRLALLEERLSTRLIERSTRSLRLTEAGVLFYDYCARIAADTEAAEAALGQLQTVPQGILRITTTQPFAETVLGTFISEFLERYEDVQIHTLVSDHYVDLIKEGIDLAIRLGPLEDSSLVARRLGRLRNVLCASPAYLAKWGTPVSPKELKTHSCIGYGTLGGPLHWIFQEQQGTLQLTLAGRFVVNNHLAAREAAVAGLGITLLPESVCYEHIKAQQLKAILNHYMPPARDFYLVYPSNRHLSTKARAFSDFLADKFTPEVPWQHI